MLFSEGTSLKRRLIITGLSLAVIVGIAAATVFFATRQYSFYLERSSNAQQTYSSYLAVSDHTYRKLSAMGEIVTDGSVLEMEERYRNQKALVEALKKVRENIDKELAHAGDNQNSEELIHFNQIEAIAKQIISGSKSVRTAVRLNDRQTAKEALDQLRSNEIEGNFNNLIDKALEQELQAVRETQRVARELDSFLTKLIPFLVFAFLLLVAALIYATWQALTRSLKVFEEAAGAYHKGDFSYKIQNVDEAEFADLADTLNSMAAEITTQRERERITQENLESLVSTRTRELENSNAKLTVANDTRKRFLADISHELRTPLTIIQGESDVALRGNKKTVDQYIEALSRVKEQSIHTAKLVQDLLFVARTEDGKAPINKQLVAPQTIIQNACNDFKTLASERGISITERFTNSDFMAHLDVGKFKQVITILLDNAIRYSHRDSTIEVRLRKDKQQAALQVIDTGIGLDANESHQVFSRYYRGNDGAGAPTGTGLGLPVAKAIIDAHGGSIELVGKKGCGTTATVLFPIENSLS